eukprot:m.227386 g.227386  ORF g.227386 m.227386 type:complete len:912 (+) comp11577_c0_seq1:124-2859(+)
MAAKDDKPKDAKPAAPAAPVEMSEEDKQLKADLELLVERLKDTDASLHKPALQSLITHIRTATSSMTSVPKPLKFLRSHFDAIRSAYENMMLDENKALAADILSLMATTRDNDLRECLKYRLAGSDTPLEQWGHEYVRHLQGEIAAEYATQEEGPASAQLIRLAAEIVPYCMKHNAEAEACDLLMELERLDLLAPHVDDKSYERVCLYLFSCVPYVAEPEDTLLLQTCLDLYSRFGQWPQAMLMALRLGDSDKIRQVLVQCTDRDVRRQIAFMLARQNHMVPLEGIVEDDEADILTSLMSNSRLSESFLSLARELDIMEPKTPDDIYKTNVEPQRSTVDSARANLSAAFVNAFVNAGFGSDKLMLSGGANGSQFIHKQKDLGIMSATASIGMLLLWDVDGGLSQIDAYMLSNQDYVRAGALLAVGIVSAGVRNDCDPALALLSEFTMHNTACLRIGSSMGLGLAYAGSANEGVADLLLPVLEDASASFEVVAVAALALGQIYVGTAHGGVTEALVTTILTRDLTGNETHVRSVVLALGLLYLNRQAAAEVTLATLATLPAPHNTIACTIVESCAYAATGNVLKIQKLLHVCSAPSETEALKAEAAAAAENGTAAPAAGAAPAPASKDGKADASKDKSKEKEAKAKASDMNQAFSVLGIAMIALGEEIGTDMALRTFNHLLHYGDQSVRRAVPVALGLLYVSNPQLNVLDILSKLSHDSDAEVAHAAIIAMGLVSAGTNQARVAAMLRTLAQYYGKDANALFMVRLAQGLLHTGKGSITLSPLHTERSLVSPVALAGLLCTLSAVMESQTVLLKSGHFMLFHLALAMYPRILCTFDTSLAPLSVPVRVGQAVDVVAQAGRPKTITGFVTSTTPVLLGYGERAQLATDQHAPLTPLLEGFVILKKTPEGHEAK